MDLTLAKRHRQRFGYFRNMMFKNPLLVLGLDLPFVVACAISLKIAAALSVEMFIVHIPTVIVSMITVRFLPRWSRMLVNIGFATIMMTLARWLVTGLFPDLSNYVAMYVYLMAINGMTVYESASITRASKPLLVIRRAFLCCTAFSVTMGLVSFIRELMGNGTLWGVEVPIPIKLQGFLYPFSGFIIMGFIMAIARFFNKKLIGFTLSESIRRDMRYTELN